MDAPDSLISASARCFDGRTQRSHGQHPPTGSDDFSIRALRAGMKNMNTVDLRHFSQAGDPLAGLVFVRVAGRGEHDRDRRPRVPFDGAVVDLAVNRRDQQRKQIGFHPR